MIVPRYREVVEDAKLLTPTFVVSNLPQQTVNLNIGNDAPIEEIHVIVNMTVAALAAAMVADGVFNILRNVRLTCVEPSGTRIPVNISGAALLELATYEHINNDASTLAALSLVNNNSIRATTKLRITYRIPMTHPRFTDAMRLRTLLPVHTYKQPSILTLEFGQASDISSVADPVTAFAAEVVVIRRRLTDEWVAQGADSFNYFVKNNLTEIQQAVAVSLTATAQRMTLQSPGRVSGLMLRWFKGNATLARATFDGSTTLGQETIWEIQQNKIPVTRFRLKHLQVENQMVKTKNGAYSYNLLDAVNSLSLAGLTGATPPIWITAITIAAASDYGGGLSTGLTIQDPASNYVDFAGSPAQEIYEPGSFLNVTLPSAQLTELVGNVTTPANQVSIIKATARVFDEAIDAFKKS